MSIERPYQTYLIRLWPTQRGGLCRYRVTLDDVHTHEHHDFADVESLIAFLRAQEDGLIEYDWHADSIET